MPFRRCMYSHERKIEIHPYVARRYKGPGQGRIFLHLRSFVSEKPVWVSFVASCYIFFLSWTFLHVVEFCRTDLLYVRTLVHVNIVPQKQKYWWKCLKHVAYILTLLIGLVVPVWKTCLKPLSKMSWKADGSVFALNVSMSLCSGLFFYLFFTMFYIGHIFHVAW